MTKKIVVFIAVSMISLGSFAQFGLYASAAYLNVNGNSAFYNNTAPGLGQDIGSLTFQGTTLGTFEQNSGSLKLIGSEIKTYKGVSDNVCSGTLNFTVYPTGSRPVSPIFTAIDLGFYSDCFAPSCGSFFGSYIPLSGGGCCSAGDQKWQNPGTGIAANIDLTTYTPDNYTLEMYYSYTGQDGGAGCSTIKYDNNNNNPVNYTASFTISTPVPVSFGNIYAVHTSSGNNIYWNTYSESHTDIFILERSINGINFHPIGQIPAAGFSSVTRNYSIQDKSPLNGINYYRVKMVESDSKYQYSSIVKAGSKTQAGWQVINNPGSENIVITGTEKGDRINIVNPLGASIYTNRSNGNNIIIYTSAFPSGIYFISVLNNKGIETRQIVINR